METVISPEVQFKPRFLNLASAALQRLVIFTEL